MSIKLRRVALWILVIFALYAVFNSPDKAAGVTRDALDGIVGGFQAVGRFFDGVLAG